MSKTVRCPKCDSKNTEERIFCYNCGGILTVLAAKEQRVHRQHVRAVRRSAVMLVLIGLLACVGLALWSPQGAVGAVGSSGEAAVTSQNLYNLRLMDGGKVELGRDFSEVSVNAYLQEFCAEDLGFDAVSVQLLPEKLRLRIRGELGAWTCAGYGLSPTLTREFVLAVEDHGVVMERALVGHLPLPTVLARRSFALLKHELADAPCLKMLGTARHVAVNKGRLHISFGGD
ncbi:MAG: hypothetical protein HQ523_02965 [Lentisphaerae bacterium]|nr:hypothetical protein [Lentisphaerota bacterium]